MIKFHQHGRLDVTCKWSIVIENIFPRVGCLWTYLVYPIISWPLLNNGTDTFVSLPTGYEKSNPQLINSLYLLFSNSLIIIHKIQTKKISTEMVVWICGQPLKGVLGCFNKLRPKCSLNTACVWCIAEKRIFGLVSPQIGVFWRRFFSFEFPGAAILKCDVLWLQCQAPLLSNTMLDNERGPGTATITRFTKGYNLYTVAEVFKRYINRLNTEVTIYNQLISWMRRLILVVV